MSRDYLYSNGLVSSLTQNLFTNDIYSRLLDSKTKEECLNVLSETSFALDNSQNTDKLLLNEFRSLIDFVKEESPIEQFCNFFVLPFDYQNIENYYKCSRLGYEFTSFCECEGFYTLSKIKEIMSSGSYQSFDNEFIFSALKEVENSFNLKQLETWEIDLIFKKYLFKNLLAVVKEKTLNKLLKMMISIENISIAMRAKSVFEFESQYLEGGFLSKRQLLSIFNKEKSILNDDFDIAFYQFIKIALSDNKQKAFTNFEKDKNNFILDFFSKKRNEINNISPFGYYCYKKLRDIKNVRLILSLQDNNMSEYIKDKLLGDVK